MTSMGGSDTAHHCNAEIARIEASWRDGPQCVGAMVGWLDWWAERLTIEEGMKVSDTKLIATKLLRWVHISPADGLQVLKEKVSIICGDRPDFTTLDGCRAFENALAERSLLGEYRKALLDLHKSHEQVALFSANSMSWACWVMLRATPAQRVAACVRVINEAGM